MERPSVIPSLGERRVGSDELRRLHDLVDIAHLGGDAVHRHPLGFGGRLGNGVSNLRSGGDGRQGGRPWLESSVAPSMAWRGESIRQPSTPAQICKGRGANIVQIVLPVALG